MMEWISEQVGVSPDTISKIVATLVTFAVLVLGRWIILRALARAFSEDWDEYRARKAATYAATVVAIIVLVWIWVDAFDDLPTFLGLISAGIAIALADVLKNLAGWAYILSRRPFRLGDRIEVSDSRGDVVDIRLFRFSLMEVGEWVDADQSTGRLLHVPNGIVFTNKVANYTEGFNYIWHELAVLVTFESDHRKARAIIEGALRQHAPDVERTAGDLIRETARKYHIRVGAITPIVYLTVRDSGIRLTARYLVSARQRRHVEQALWTQILDEFGDERAVELAYPTVRTYFDGPIAVSRPPEREEGSEVRDA